MILRDLGGHVIRVEEVGSIAARRAEQMKCFGIGPIVCKFTLSGSPYDPLNRNKRRIGLNLRPMSQRIFSQLGVSAEDDVVSLLCQGEEIYAILAGSCESLCNRIESEVRLLSLAEAFLIYRNIAKNLGIVKRKEDSVTEESFVYFV
jgi:hypothetical protein